MSLTLARVCARALATLKDLDGDAPPSPRQADALRGWRGWGPLAPALDPFRTYEGGWKDVSAQLTDLLTREERLEALEASSNAFYTSPAVVAQMWRLLIGLGLPTDRPLRGLEPGCGAGVFMDGIPDGLDVHMTGVEKDPVTAAIARLLHPRHSVIGAPLELTTLRIGAFDFAVGNVPFSEVTIFDPAWPKEEARFEPSLHNYFMWRAIEAVRPGGLIALITSRYTMDANRPHRTFFSRSAAFVGAIRLPTGTFGDLGTDVVTDIVVLRRLTDDEPAALLQEREAAWAATRDRPDLTNDANHKVRLNTYWDTHPHLVLGELRPRAGVRHGRTLDVVVPEGAAPAAMLAGAVDHLTGAAADAGLVYAPDPDDVGDDIGDGTDPGLREGAHTLHGDGSVTRIVDGTETPVRASAELKQLILLKDAAISLFDAEGDDTRADDEVTPLRDHCRALYRQYVARFGPLHRSVLRNGKPDPETGMPTVVRSAPSLGGIRIDPDWPTLSAVEDWDDDTETARPARILTTRVNRPVQRRTRAESPADALALCMDRFGRFDLTYAHDLLGCDSLAETVECMSGLVFQDPQTREWVAAEEYLSGNVRAKLRAAKEAADGDPRRWAQNVTALAEVQPPELGPMDIIARLGSPWIPADVVAQFVAETFDTPVDGVSVTHEPFSASWEIRAPGARSREASRTRWGTSRVNAVDLIAHALNGSSVTVWDRREEPRPDRPGLTRTVKVRNSAETMLAQDRQNALQDEFRFWLWCDPDRTDRLVEIYNDLYNARRLRVFDGSAYTFPGLVAGFEPYSHQRDMVARIIGTTGAASLCGYGVGAGKTATMAMGALKLRELGIARKPLVIVPKHLLEQIAGDFRRLYPAARILMVRREDLTPARRKAFLAKVAANDWDCVVMTHRQFQSIPVSAKVEAEYVERLLLDYQRALSCVENQESRTAKRLGKEITKLRQRHRKLMAARRDDGLWFERLGVDFLMVDEFHFFKRLAAPSRMEGFSLPGSQRAEDLHMKMEWLRHHRPDGRCAALFTATPVSNSMAELYTLMRYLAPDLLREAGIDSFDAFAGMFIDYATRIEVAPDGSGFRLHRRPSEFTNVPDLNRLVAEFADIRTRRKLNLPGPRVDRRLVEVEGPPELADITDEIVRRSNLIRGGKVNPKQDNMLALCNDGRLAAVDPRLLGRAISGPTKLHAIAKNVAAEYHATKDQLYPPVLDDEGVLWAERPGGFQMVFLDLGTPNTKKGDQAYGWLREEMVALGVPTDEIAYIHDAHTDAERKAMFAACRDGRIKVLIASTEKAGTGVNVQHRMVAIHHGDIPFRPDQFEQRDGRGDRPGNCNDVIRIYVYVTIGSFDPYMLQMLERKQRMVDQTCDCDPTVRVVTAAASEQEQYWALVKALSTGQADVMELEELRGEVTRLQNQAAAHARDQVRLRGDYASLSDEISQARSTAAALACIAEKADNAPRRLVRRNPITTSRFTTREEIAAQVRDGITAALNAPDNDTRIYIGFWRGVAVSLTRAWRQEGAMLKPGVAFTLHPPRPFEAMPGGLVPDGHTADGPDAVLAAVDYAIDNARVGAAAHTDRADYLQSRRDEVQELLTPFPHQAALNEATARRDALEAEIAAELDKTPAAARAAQDAGLVAA